MNVIEDNLLTTEQVAGRLRMSRRTLEKMRGIGEGPDFLWLKGRVFYPETKLVDWLTAQVKTAKSHHETRLGFTYGEVAS